MATQEQIDRMHAMAPAAQAAELKWKVPSSITLAQWALESGWGGSDLALQAKNYFGIKAEHLNVPNSYVMFPTDDFVNGVKKHVLAGFEKYKTAEDCFDDHGRLLHDASRYQPAMRVAKSPDDFARMLRVCGYSTLQPMNAYPDRLIALMRQHNLYQYDNPPLPPAAEQEAA